MEYKYYTLDMAKRGSVKKVLKSLIVYGSLILATYAFAENFRTHSTQIIELENTLEKKSAEASINDSIAVKLPEDSTFIQGIELNIKVPKVITEWRDCVAWSLYSSISPEPEAKKIDYSGVRAETGTFESLSLTVLVPLEKNNTIKKDVYSYMAEFLNSKEDGFIFLRFQLVMKGVSSEIMESKFTVTAKPIFIDKGIVSLKTLTEDGNTPESYSVFLDGNQVDAEKISAGGILTDTGEHTLNIVSTSYRNEMRTITVEQAKITEVDLTLRDVKPVIRIAAPEKAKVFFDSKEFEAPVEPFSTTQGDHTVKFLIGDYEIVRSVTVFNGRNYNISIVMEAQIEETEE